MSQTPAGWYPQPDGQQRYWDGNAWTDQFAPGAPPVSPSTPGTGGGMHQPAPVADKRNWFLRHKILTAIAGIAVIAGIGQAASGGGGGAQNPAAVSDKSQTQPVQRKGDSSKAKSDNGTKTSAVADNEPDSKASGLNVPVRDGKFEFIVKSIDCGKKSVGGEFANQKAQGQYCLVKMTVRNIGDKAQMLAGGNQFAYDAKGREFTNDTAAEIFIEGNNTFLENINPGNSAVGTLVFDIPKNVEITKLKLHDSMFSGGVEVQAT